MRNLPNCLDCNIQLKDYRSIRCWYCATTQRSQTYKKGQISPRKGKQHSFESNEKNRQAHLGTKHSPETRRKMSKAARKVVAEGRHNFYIDGRSKNYIGTNARKIVHNKLEYKLWREAVFKRDNYTCRICFKSGIYLEADHIKPWCLFPTLRYAIDNGRTLCRDCHKETDTYGYKALLWKEVNYS